MSPLDKKSLESKIARIRRNIRELKKLASLPYEEYAGNLQYTATAERLIHVSIEAMLDIGSHIIAEKSLGEPLEYRDIFKLLVKGKILPKEKEESFIQLAGLRNRIVHVYDEIDHKLLHQAMKKDLTDFDLFITEITRYLEE